MVGVGEGGERELEQGRQWAVNLLYRMHDLQKPRYTQITPTASVWAAPVKEFGICFLLQRFHQRTGGCPH